MMVMKKAKLLIVLFLVASSTIWAQTLSDAIKLTTNEQFEKADEAFKNLIQFQPNNGEIYFYYGENYFKNENIEMANKFYQKGADINATNPFCYIGLGKTQWFQGKQTEAKANFFKAITLAAGKNATVLIKIAEAYIYGDNKDIAEALNLLGQASKLEPKNPAVYIAIGDAYLEQNDGTKAVDNYEKASALDPKSVRSILRQGQVWNRAKNYNLAIDTYKKAKLIDSTFAPAYRELAEIYLRAGQYGNAVYNAKRYLDLNNDCSTLGRYAGMLLGAKQYKDAVVAAVDAQKCDPNNLYLNRYLAFSQCEVGDYPNGLLNSDAFFAKATVDVKIIPLDYEYHAKLLSKNGKDSLAIIDYKKALELEPEKLEINGDIANCYIKMKKYNDAITYYKIKVELNKANANDYYGLVRAYYYSKDFINADSSAVQIIKSQPDLTLGYLWRAKANLQLDHNNEKWIAKPYYEQFIAKVKPEETDKNKKDLVDAYTYLAAYYAKNKDCPNTILYFKKVLEVDPTNAQAKNFMAKPCN